MRRAGTTAKPQQRHSAPTRLAAAGALGYLLGTLPSADLAVRAAGGGVDMRAVGSGNPGALNAAHALGCRWGLAVLGADMAKGDSVFPESLKNRRSVIDSWRADRFAVRALVGAVQSA